MRALNRCLHELIEEQALRTPAAAAVAFEGERLSYAELDQRASALAKRLRERGAGPDVRVALFMERSLALVNPYDRPLEKIITRAKIDELGSKTSVPVNSSDRIGALTKLDYGPGTYLYAARVFEPQFQAQIQRANDVLHDYQVLLSRSRTNQLRFNAALLMR